MGKFRVFTALMILVFAQVSAAAPASAVSCLESWAISGYVHNFDFSGCDLTRASLGESDLSGANFTNANLTQSNLWGRNFSGANFTGANLTGADLRTATLIGANFTRANLTNARLTTYWPIGGVRYPADFKGANLTDANLTRCSAAEADFTNANLTRTNFVACAMERAKGTGIIGKPVGLSSLNKIVNGTMVSTDYVGASITGTLLPGKKLLANHSNYYDPRTIWDYQWFRGANEIPNATKSSYVLTPDDCDTQIKVRISFSAQTFSLNDSPVTTIPRCIMKPTAPKLAGLPKVKQIIKVTTSAWVKGAEITYQWLLDGQPIEGATASKISLLSSDKGCKISVRVTQSRIGYEPAIATSAALKIL